MNPTDIITASHVISSLSNTITSHPTGQIVHKQTTKHYARCMSNLFLQISNIHTPYRTAHYLYIRKYWVITMIGGFINSVLKSVYNQAS